VEEQGNEPRESTTGDPDAGVADDWQENSHDDRRARETVTTSNDEGSNGRTDSNDDYKFLKHTREMSTLDRYFVNKHAPTVYKLRKSILVISIIASIALGVLAWLNFQLYDGNIIVFKEKYNLGRVQTIIDEYYPEELVRRYAEEDDNDLDIDEASDAAFGSDIVVIGGSGSFDSGGGGSVPSQSSTGQSATTTAVGGLVVDPPSPPPSTRSPSKKPITAAPNTRPICESRDVVGMMLILQTCAFLLTL